MQTKTLQNIWIRILLALSVGSLFCAGAVSAQTVLQAYGSDQTLQSGMLVTIKKDDPSKIEAVTDKTLGDLKGVVADQNDSTIVFTDPTKKYYVATSGAYETLVSNENGQIKQGDYISISSLEGIGMKATTTQSIILGRATADFEGGGDSIGRSKTKDGKEVSFGRIRVDIGVGSNPVFKEATGGKVMNALQEFTSNIANKPVNTTRLYLAILIFIVSAGVAGFVLIGGVRGGLISLGRNPLSKKTIFRGMIQTIVIGLLIFTAGVFGVYLLIKV